MAQININMDQIKPGLNYTLVGTDIDEGSIEISKNGGPSSLHSLSHPTTSCQM